MLTEILYLTTEIAETAELNFGGSLSELVYTHKSGFPKASFFKPDLLVY
jgi:hypothetical protein